jgi:hypothetical protein
MRSVSTIALLSKRDDIPVGLFGAYWRDVHGILAARIPGFDSYIQFHLGSSLHNSLELPKGISTAVSKGARFHGIAEVTFRSEEDRNGLGSSVAAAHIQSDEKYVFKSSLLYNLKPGSSNTYLSSLPDEPDVQPMSSEIGTVFLLLARRSGISHEHLIQCLENTLIKELAAEAGVVKLRMHALASGDPSQWQTPGVDNDRTAENSFDAVLQVTVLSKDGIVKVLNKALARIPGELSSALKSVHGYQVRGRYQMVKGGRPTHLGLRGLDVLKTIEAAGASNQLSAPVVETIYGICPAT